MSGLIVGGTLGYLGAGALGVTAGAAVLGGAALGGMASSAFGGKPDAPAAPDPYAVAGAQGTVNKDTAKAQAELDRYNQVNPNGSITWSVDKNGKWTQDTKLTPEGQRLADSRIGLNQGLTNLASRQLGTMQDLSPVQQYTKDLAGGQVNLAALGQRNLGASMQTPFNYDSAPAAPGQLDYSSLGALPKVDHSTRESVIDALYGQATSRLDPRFKQETGDLTAQLAAQGITQGSEAYNREMNNLALAKNDAYGGALNSAIINGGNAENQQVATALGVREAGGGELRNAWDAGLIGRQQGITEANSLRALPLNEATTTQNLTSNATSDYLNTNTAGMNQLTTTLTGGAGPAATFNPYANNAQIAATPLAQSVYNSFAGNVANANAKTQSNNAMLEGLTSLATAFI